MIAPVPHPVRLIPRAEVERLLDVDELLDALALAFEQLSAGAASVPPRIAAFTPDGLLGAMPAYLPGAGLEIKLVSVFPANHGRGLPSHQALIALFDEGDGHPLAIMDGTVITAVRTAAAAALSARLLARPDARVLTILGAGVQGRSHLRVMPRVRTFTEIRIASRTLEHARSLAAEQPGAVAVADFEAAVRGADVVCCCTDAAEPIVHRAWLAPGTHVTSVGGTRGPELAADVVQADVLAVESRAAAFLKPPAGSHELQGLDPDSAVELGELLSGARPGRAGDQELTVYKSMGHAVEDVAAARLVFARAMADNLGTPFTF
jgi:ornithine cyclodeaminase/alanine dehydrogenase-like protein (mu-crystallin family)